ncbi:hypothetical protein DFR60_105319 [Hungatella effluvii]|uniref:Uncharacterized protein n=1 Tax=Hungatella effluvii TaxID=1096246 RepID=A0A2V3Y5S4_9FIRM|nr:hypothetical protein [Hungatella effluvii]PXX53830.1 hypothetical protein DFR60_105319 [Hungatella effluvii]
MKNFFSFETMYVRITFIIILLTTYLVPRHGELDGFGYPFAYINFPSGRVGITIFRSTYVNILYLFLDFILIYMAVKIFCEAAKKIFK